MACGTRSGPERVKNLHRLHVKILRTWNAFCAGARTELGPDRVQPFSRQPTAQRFTTEGAEATEFIQKKEFSVFSASSVVKACGKSNGSDEQILQARNNACRAAIIPGENTRSDPAAPQLCSTYAEFAHTDMARFD